MSFEHGSLSYQTRRELLARVAPMYQMASPAHKHLILNDFVKLTGYARKSAIRLLNHPPSGTPTIRRLRLPIYNVGQSGRPVVLCGTVIPEQFEVCPERRYFSTLHYLAIVCDDQLLEERLKQRPAWRHSGSTESIETMIQFNQWLKEHASTTRPPMTLVDTGYQSIPETVRHVAQWIQLRL